MNKTKNADSLVWIIVWVFILSITLLWIINILTYNKTVSSTFEDNIYNYLINTNWDNIIKKINTDGILYDENFYIYKDKINKNFIIYTWAINKNYAYIDKLWNNVDKNKNIGKTYERVFDNQTDVLRHNIEPNEISDLVLHFDAKNIDWTYNSSLSNLDKISTWLDLSWNNNNWIQNNPSNKPIFTSTWITNNPYVKFNWNQMFEIANSWSLNDDWNIWTNLIYNKKSIALVLKTWFDNTIIQNIYEQWDESKWYAIQIENSNLYAWIWNNTWDSWHQFKRINMWEIIPDSTYFIILVQDSTNINDIDNKLKIYLNWNLIDEINHVDPQTEHSWKIWLWSVFKSSNDILLESSIITTNYLDYINWAWIWEFIIWNYALSKNDIRWLNNYFNTKWLNLDWHIIYNVITNKTIKYNF